MSIVFVWRPPRGFLSWSASLDGASCCGVVSGASATGAGTVSTFGSITGTLAYQMDGIFIGATWSSDMRNMMLLSVLIFLIVWLCLAPLFGNHGLWIALLVFLGARSITLYWRMRRLLPLTFGEV